MVNRWWSSVAVALVLVLVTMGSGVAQSPIKIGVIQPLSGPVAASGNYIRMGAEIARDWINAKGGVNGRKIELQIEDNKSDPKEAASAAEKLIVRDKVPAIMGAWGSSMTLAAMPKLEEYGVPMVVETSSAASITKRGNPWVFRISPPSEMEALGLEQYVGKLGVKRADFLAVNTDWGRGAWVIGSHPLFVLGRGLYRMFERPWVVGGLAFFLNLSIGTMLQWADARLGLALSQALFIAGPVALGIRWCFLETAAILPCAPCWSCSRGGLP